MNLKTAGPHYAHNLFVRLGRDITKNKLH